MKRSRKFLFLVFPMNIEISVQDIQQILLNEYSLKVINVSGQCSLGGVENAKPTMWNLQMYIKVIGLSQSSA